jgi:hypothetical protein
MRKRVFGNLVIAFLLAAGNGFAQTPDVGASQANTSIKIVGVVTAVDRTTNQITIKNDKGETHSIVTSTSASLLRLPPGETSARNAIKITLADVVVGDKLFASGTSIGDGKSINARQVVVTSAAATGDAAQDQQVQRENFRRRGLMGRITALNPDKKEITVQSRSREGTGPITVVVSDATRFFRYAPDSMNIKDASRSSLAELRIGDQLRALDDRNADGTQFSAEEIIAGSMARTGGQVVAVDPSKNEVTIKNSQGQNITVKIGARSSLRRVTPEAAASFEANRPQGRGRNAGETRQAGQEGRSRERRERGAGAGGEERRWRGGGGFQQMLEGLPAITVNDLKKGDTVFVSGSEGADPKHLTAIMLVTGDPAFMIRLLQPGPNRGPQSPGLPGDVLGGGVGSAERPTSP